MRQHETLVPLEIKSCETIQPAWFKGLDYVKSVEPAARGGLLVYGGRAAYERNGVRVVGWRSVAEALDQVRQA